MTLTTPESDSDAAGPPNLSPRTMIGGLRLFRDPRHDGGGHWSHRAQSHWHFKLKSNSESGSDESINVLVLYYHVTLVPVGLGPVATRRQCGGADPSPVPSTH